MKTLKLNEYNQQCERCSESATVTSRTVTSRTMNNLNQSKQYREIFNDFGIAFEQYVELLHKGNPMAKRFYLNALELFSERLNKYAAEYADKLLLE